MGGAYTRVRSKNGVRKREIEQSGECFIPHSVQFTNASNERRQPESGRHKRELRRIVFTDRQCTRIKTITKSIERTSTRVGLDSGRVNQRTT